MAINNKFIHFKTKVAFRNHIKTMINANDNQIDSDLLESVTNIINPTQWNLFKNYTVFIKDTAEIWTHCKTYANNSISDAGSSTKPIYINNGVPTELSYSLNKTVPSNAVFTDYQATLDGHYTPADGSAVTNSDSGLTLGFGGAVITSIATDDNGHITNVFTSKLPSQPSTGVLNAFSSLRVYTGASTYTTLNASGSDYFNIKPGNGIVLEANSSQDIITINIDDNNIATQDWVNGLGFVTSDTNTWRPIKVGTTILSNLSQTANSYLEFKSGSGIEVTMNSNGQITITNTEPNESYILSSATNTALGGVKPWAYKSLASKYNGGTTGAGSSATAVNVNSISTDSLRYYAVEGDVNGRLFVNVPWTDTISSYTLPLASSSTRGGIKIGYSPSSSYKERLPLELSSEQAYVTLTADAVNKVVDIPTIPSSLPNPSALVINGTSYDGSSPVTINTSTLEAATSSSLGGIKIGYTASGANIPVKLSSDKAYVTLTSTAINAAVTIPSTSTIYSNTVGNVIVSDAANSTAAASAGLENPYLNFISADGSSVLKSIRLVSGTGITIQNVNGTSIGIKSTSSGSEYTLPEATSDVLGGVMIGDNITNDAGLISIENGDVVAALGYTPKKNLSYSNYTYSSTSLAITANTSRYPSSYTNYSSALTISVPCSSFSTGDDSIVVVYGTRTVNISASSGTLIKQTDILTTGSSTSSYRIYSFSYISSSRVAVNCAEYKV